MNNTPSLRTSNEIIRAIGIMIETTLKQLSFNYYITGRIKTVNGDGTYLVTIDDKDETLKAREGVNLVVEDIVLIMIPNSQRSHAFVDCKRPY